MMPLQFTVQTGLQYFKQKYPAISDENSTEKIIHTAGDVWGKLSDIQRVVLNLKWIIYFIQIT